MWLPWYDTLQVPTQNPVSDGGIFLLLSAKTGNVLAFDRAYIEYRGDIKTNKTPNGTWFAQTMPILFLNPDAWYRAYTYNAKDKGINPLPQESITYYLENSTEYLGKYGNMRFSNKQPNGQIGVGTTVKRPLCFDYEQLSLKYNLSIEVEMEDIDTNNGNEPL